MDCCCWEHRRLGPQPDTPEEDYARMQRMVAQITSAMSESVKERQTMGDFNINITATGGHGCERKAKAGEKLYGRCGRFNCPDCMAYEFVQQLKQRGMFMPPNAKAEFTHWPNDEKNRVVDDMLANERKAGQF